MRWLRKEQIADNTSETNSDAAVGNAWQSDFTGSEYCDAGHSIPVGTWSVPFYTPNPARNNGQDIEPVPITPVRQQNWPEMQIQLKNGWGSTSFGKKLAYDDYLRMLTDSATRTRRYLIPNPAGIGPNAVNPGPSPANVNQYIQNTAGSQPTAPGGPGFIASGVKLNGIAYYG